MKIKKEVIKLNIIFYSFETAIILIYVNLIIYILPSIRPIKFYADKR